MVLAAGTIGTYVQNYMTTFAQATLHMRPGIVVHVHSYPSTFVILISADSSAR